MPVGSRISSIGGWGCGTVVRRTRTGKSISIALALRACVRAKLRVRDDSAMARVGQINLSVVHLPRSRDTFFAFGLGLCEDVQLSLTSVSVNRSR